MVAAARKRGEVPIPGADTVRFTGSVGEKEGFRTESANRPCRRDARFGAITVTEWVNGKLYVKARACGFDLAACRPGAAGRVGVCEAKGRGVRVTHCLLWLRLSFAEPLWAPCPWR